METLEINGQNSSSFVDYLIPNPLLPCPRGCSLEQHIEKLDLSNQYDELLTRAFHMRKIAHEFLDIAFRSLLIRHPEYNPSLVCMMTALDKIDEMELEFKNSERYLAALSLDPCKAYALNSVETEEVHRLFKREYPKELVMHSYLGCGKNFALTFKSLREKYDSRDQSLQTSSLIPYPKDFQLDESLKVFEEKEELHTQLVLQLFHLAEVSSAMYNTRVSALMAEGTLKEDNIASLYSIICKLQLVAQRVRQTSAYYALLHKNIKFILKKYGLKEENKKKAVLLAKSFPITSVIHCFYGFNGNFIACLNALNDLHPEVKATVAPKKAIT